MFDESASLSAVRSQYSSGSLLGTVAVRIVRKGPPRSGSLFYHAVISTEHCNGSKLPLENLNRTLSFPKGPSRANRRLFLALRFQCGIAGCRVNPACNHVSRLWVCPKTIGRRPIHKLFRVVYVLGVSRKAICLDTFIWM